MLSASTLTNTAFHYRLLAVRDVLIGTWGREASNIFYIERKLVKHQPYCKINGHSIIRDFLK